MVTTIDKITYFEHIFKSTSNNYVVIKYQYHSLRVILCNNKPAFAQTGRVTTTGIWLSSTPATRGRKLLRTAWWPTSLRAISPTLNCPLHTPSGWAWPSTSPSFTMKSWTPPTGRAGWPRQLSTMPSPSWTHWARRATRIRHSSCSCYETTSPSGRRTFKEKVSFSAV